MQGSIQRVIGMIRQGSSDRIPRGEITIDDTVVADRLGCRLVGFDERLQFCSLLGLDLFCVSPLPPHPSDRLPRPQDLTWPDLKAWVRRSSLFTFAILDGSFGWGVRIFGFQKFFVMGLKDPDGLREFNKGVERLNRELAARLAEEGVHGLMLADDIAHQNGLFVGPDAMSAHFLPSLSRQAERILPLGVILFFHSDGAFMDVLPQIAGMGFHGFHCIDAESGMELARVRARLGKEFCLWGTVTARELERCETPEEQEVLVRNIRGAASAGRFILGTTSGLFRGLRVDALKAIYSRI